MIWKHGSRLKQPYKMPTITNIHTLKGGLLFAQSNGDGRGDKGDAPSHYLQPAKYSYIWTGSTLEIFHPQADGVAGNHYYPGEAPSDPTNQHGPEIGLIRQWEDMYDSPLVLLKFAIGGIPLLKGAATTQGVFDPQENELSHSIENQWRKMLRHIKATYNKPFKCEFVYWWQGEADWSYLAPNNLGQYKAGLIRLHDFLKEMTGNPDLKLIMSMPVRYNWASSSADENWVRYEQIEYATENPNVAITTGDLGSFHGQSLLNFTSDLTHVLSRPLIEEGHRAAYIYDRMIQGDSASSAVSSLVSTPTDTTVALSWSGTSREFIIKINGKVHGITSATSYTIDGLMEGTAYTVEVLTHNDAWEVVATSDSFTTTGSSPQSWDQEVDLLNASYTELQIKDFILKRIGGGYPGTIHEVLSDPNYSGGSHITTAAGSSYRNECGFLTYRLSDFENTDPGSGSMDDLRSEIKVATRIDATGKFLFYGTYKQFKWAVWEVDTIARTVSFLRETDTDNLDTDYHHTIMPHPDEDDTVMFADTGGAVKKINLRTGGTPTTMYTLPFSPPLDWGKKDGNGLWMRDGNDCIICSDTGGPNHPFILKMSTGEAVNTVNGVTTVVPIASRQSVQVTPNAGSDLDHMFTDGRYIYAVIKNGAGPNGGSGLFIFDSSGFIEEVLGSGTGHYSHQWATFGGTQRFSVTWKLTPGNATELGSPFSQGDITTCAIDISYSSGYSITYEHKRSLDWVYSASTASGGQQSGIDSIADVAAISMTTAHTNVNGRHENTTYIDDAFFGKEEIFLLHLDSASENQFTRVGKNLSRLKINVDTQTEMNLLHKAADGTIYLVFYSRIGPPKGSTSFVNPSEKDCWLVIIPPQMPSSRIDYYLAL